MSEAPFINTLISASAGSGKTHQLTNRYLTLLAARVKPEAILATTFTRKAAGEIFDRALARLAKGASDPEQAKKLADQLWPSRSAPCDFAGLLRETLRSLHRVRIGTLDSFFVSLASTFSLETELPAGWSICEIPDDEQLQQEALEKLLEERPDDIAKLLPLLCKGETHRSIQRELAAVIADHYQTFRESKPEMWRLLQVPEPVAESIVAGAIEQLSAFDFMSCRDRRFVVARDDDLDRFQRQDWSKFLSTGLSGKIFAGETTYCKKTIPPGVYAHYQTLIRHACSETIRKIAHQTQATWDFLNHFHEQLWPLKQSSGKLRFQELTQALADAQERGVLSTLALGFRLDGAVDHLLLDEFQDTSLAQWRVLEPIAKAITKGSRGPRRSFFCVGDIKQAIYGWRGGMGEIFEKLPSFLGPLDERPLLESRRSAQPIIDVVNQIFSNLGQFDPGEKIRPGMVSWAQRFQSHTTHEKDIPGYVCLQAGPGQRDGEGLAEHRGRHCQFVADAILELRERAKSRSIGVLCRDNKTVARMIYELRERKIDASEEGGIALTDSAAVELILSLFTLADHPGHSIAWFHLKNSVLSSELKSFTDAEGLSKSIRRDLLAQGYGKVSADWARRIAPSCNHRDLSRLQQFVEMAYNFEPRSSLRAGEFVAWAREKRVPDPSFARVRVMTIHGAKGLEFDAVVLPELDVTLKGNPPTLVVGRDPQTLEANFVCRYAAEEFQQLLNAGQRQAFDKERQSVVEESLSLLYVAMTRAIHALYLFIPGTRNSKRKGMWSTLLEKTLAPVGQATESGPLFEIGDPDWSCVTAVAPSLVARSPDRATSLTGPILFRADPQKRRRGLERMAPSRREGNGLQSLKKLFDPSEGTGMSAGALYHHWFSQIEWLGHDLPPAHELRRQAEKERANLPDQVWKNLDDHIAVFRAFLEKPEVAKVFDRSLYERAFKLDRVERERKFFLVEGTQFWDGTFDRIVWFSQGDRIVAADVLDFKTDEIKPGDMAAVEERAKYYRPQMEVYRRAAARIGGISEDHVAVRLVFAKAGCVLEVQR